MKYSIKTLLISGLILLINSTIASATEAKSDQVKPAIRDKTQLEVIKPGAISRVPLPPHTHRTPVITRGEPLPIAPLPTRRVPLDSIMNRQPANSKN